VVDSSGRHTKCIGDVQWIRNDLSWEIAKGKIVLYLPISAIVDNGDILLIRGKPKRIKPPLNPGEFDYQKFMRNKGILFHHFIKSIDFMKIDHVNRQTIYHISLKVRNEITKRIKSRFSDGNTQGIMLALLTGQRNYIDPNTYNTFIQIGIIHTLAVSGLHVGIIYMFLIVLFKPLSRYTWGKKFSLCVKISVLLFFAFLTGLSPSVLRATLMFSIMITGRILNRNSHILNSVFLSAFILLCINPYFLFDVGFQLSYSAVIGIILFQPIIYSIMKVKFQVLNWIWQLASVSIAAQLGTLPFSLFYFKQFPTYFLLGNIIAIPYVTISIVSGIILIGTFPIKFMTWIIGWVLEFFTDVFLAIITTMESLPMGKIYPISISTSQSFWLFVFILSIYFMIRNRNWKMIFISMICASLIIMTDLYRKIHYRKEKKIIVYNIPYMSCTELIDGRNGIMLINDLSEQQISKIHFHTRNNIISEKRNTEIYNFSDIPREFMNYSEDGLLIFLWNSKLIAIVFSKANIDRLKFIPIDYLIISGNALNIEDLKNLKLNIKQVIWDSSNHFYQSLYKDQALNVDLHQVRIHGPYINIIN